MHLESPSNLSIMAMTHILGNDQPCFWVRRRLQVDLRGKAPPKKAHWSQPRTPQPSRRSLLTFGRPSPGGNVPIRPEPRVFSHPQSCFLAKKYLGYTEANLMSTDQEMWGLGNSVFQVDEIYSQRCRTIFCCDSLLVLKG